jgi:heme-degrading monooxygenase HmoA
MKYKEEENNAADALMISIKKKKEDSNHVSDLSLWELREDWNEFERKEPKPKKKKSLKSEPPIPFTTTLIKK